MIIIFPIGAIAIIVFICLVFIGTSDIILQFANIFLITMMISCVCIIIYRIYLNHKTSDTSTKVWKTLLCITICSMIIIVSYFFRELLLNDFLNSKFDYTLRLLFGGCTYIIYLSCGFIGIHTCLDEFEKEIDNSDIIYLVAFFFLFIKFFV